MSFSLFFQKLIFALIRKYLLIFSLYAFITQPITFLSVIHLKFVIEFLVLDFFLVGGRLIGGWWIWSVVGWLVVSGWLVGCP